MAPFGDEKVLAWPHVVVVDGAPSLEVLQVHCAWAEIEKELVQLTLGNQSGALGDKRH